MKKQLVIKLTMLSITGTLCTSIFAPSVTTFALEQNNININADSTIKNNDYNQFEKYTKYIKVIDNKYVLDTSLTDLNNLEIKKIQNQLDFTNSIIEKYGITNVSVEGGFDVYVSDYEITSKLRAEGINVPLSVQRAGVTKVKFFWWGFYLYLNSYWTGLALTAGIGGIAGGIGAILGGGVGAGVAVGVAGAVADYVASNSKLAQRGCVVSYNYAFGVQKIWAQ